jgi:hypothetical protein
MLRIGALTALAALFLTSASLPGMGAQSGTEKQPRADAPVLNREFRDRLRSREKTPADASKASTKAPARVKSPVPNGDRGREFEARAKGVELAAKQPAASKGSPRADVAGHRPVVDAAKAKRANKGDLPFDGRHGTGLGDIFEEEPNDSTADVLDDLPVNVVGEISEPDDFDFYAITATQGESIRIEIVADRIFGTALDSYLYVLADDGETVLAENDDFFSNSGDSFIRFVAPRAGEQLYFIGVTDFGGLGGDGFEYVLNVSVANAPDDQEQEINDTTSSADTLRVPSVMFGFADDEVDDDVYIFNGTGGRTLIVDVDAELFLSEMDPVVELYDDNGGFLFGVDDTDGLDPRFNILLPYSGAYYLLVYYRDPVGGDLYSYSLNISTQDGTDSPRISAFKIANGTFLKRVLGSGFDPTGGGPTAEIDSDPVASKPGKRKPTTVVKLTPAVRLRDGDVVTVVNPDGRRSNPGIVDL